MYQYLQIWMAASVSAGYKNLTVTANTYYTECTLVQQALDWKAYELLNLSGDHRNFTCHHHGASPPIPSQVLHIPCNYLFIFDRATNFTQITLFGNVSHIIGAYGFVLTSSFRLLNWNLVFQFSLSKSWVSRGVAHMSSSISCIIIVSSLVASLLLR